MSNSRLVQAASPHVFEDVAPAESYSFGDPHTVIVSASWSIESARTYYIRLMSNKAVYSEQLVPRGDELVALNELFRLCVWPAIGRPEAVFPDRKFTKTIVFLRAGDV